MPDKPKKPFPSFPLTPHVRGGWGKRYRGHQLYIPQRDPTEALAEFHRRAREIDRGGNPPPTRLSPERITLRELARLFLGEKRADRDAGKITADWYARTRRAVRRFVRHAGPDLPVSELTPGHFAAFRRAREAKAGAHAVNNAVQVVRTMFAHAADQDWCAPVRMGKQFRKVPQHEIRSSRRVLLFSDAECRRLVNGAVGQLRAMILLALNGGMGQRDVARLRVEHVAIGGSPAVVFPRPKTNVERRFPLWPETAQALRPFIAGKAPDASVFLTSRGRQWVRETIVNKDGRETVSTIDSVNLMFRRLLETLGIPRDGRAFYTLRRTFRTAADGQGDQRAIALVMGHAVRDMGGVYVQRIDDARLKSVVDHVRRSLLLVSPHRGQKDRPTGRRRPRAR